MAGMKGRSGGARENSGGAREGAGAPLKNPWHVELPAVDDDMEFLKQVRDNNEVDIRVRLDAAKARLASQRAPAAGVGKKVIKKAQADEVANGTRFGATVAPLRAVGGR